MNNRGSRKAQFQQPRVGAIGVPEKRKLFGERRNSYLKRAIAERTLFKRAADSSPYAMFSETTPFSIGGCERNGMNFDEAAPTRCLVKQHYFSFGGCERNCMNFDEAAPTRCLVKQHYFSFGGCERNGMNFDERTEWYEFRRSSPICLPCAKGGDFGLRKQSKIGGIVISLKQLPCTFRRKLHQNAPRFWRGAFAYFLFLGTSAFVPPI